MADIRLSIGPGHLVYPRLKTADTKFDELGIYKADLAVPLSECEDLVAQLMAIFKAHVGKAANKTENTMFYMETDDAGEETGRVVFKARVKNRMSKNTGELWDRRPALFDASLKPIDVNPWGGSKAVVSVDVYEWDAGGKKGVSLQPVGVQVLELVEGGGPDASSMGFSAQEGYTAPNAADDAGLSKQAEIRPFSGGGDVDGGDY